MNGRMIDATMVAQMFRNGELWHGMELEFSDTPGFEVPTPGKLTGFDPDEDIKSRFGFKRRGGVYDCAEYARFPLPDLRDGDPVVRSNGVRCHFAQWGKHGGMLVWPIGHTQWTTHNDIDKAVLIQDGRPATSQELASSGLDPNHFSGRRGINQNG